MNFDIEECYLTPVTTVEYLHIVKDKSNPTEEELLNELRYGPFKVSSLKDHPVFAELRLQLAKEGFINIENMWWNGDQVLKPFKLNSKKFKKGDRFVSAGAMAIHLKYME